MDSSSNSQNKLIVLAAVAIIGAFAGQHFFKQTSPAAPPVAPWGPGYAMQQPQIGYAPGNYQVQPYGTQHLPQQQYAYPPYNQRMEVPLQHLTEVNGAINQGTSAPSGVPSAQQSQRGLRDRRPSVAGNGGQIQLASNEQEELLLAGTPSPLVFGSGTVGVVSADVQPPRVIKIHDGDTIWTGDLLNDVILKSTSIGLTVSIEKAPKQTAGLELVASWNGGSQKIGDIAPGDFAAGKTLTIAPFSVSPAASGRTTIQVGFREGVGTSATVQNSTTINVRLPNSSVTSPNSVKASSTKNKAAVDDLSKPFNIYGGFLHLEGMALDGTSVQFLLERKLPNGSFEVALRSVGVVPTNRGIWSVDLTLPDLGPTFPDGRILVLAESAQGHAIATTPILTRRASSSEISLKFDMQDAKQGPSTGTVLSTPGYAKSKPLYFPISTTGSASDTVLVLFEEGNGTPLAKVDYSTNKPTLVWDDPKDGVYNLRVEAYQGQGKVAETKPFQISYRSTGPVPTGISPTNLSQTPGVDLVRIAFDRANPLNYSTITKEDFRLTNNADANKTVVAKSVNPIASENSVDVLFEPIPEGSYQVAVGTQLNGIQDLHGNDLAPAADNKPYTFGLIKPVGSNLPTSRTAGLSNLTGPYVAYQEFTEPRKSQAGFNPSDKVVTRVARLYYFRDAHRVVQIINRGARSFNRQAVDMQQQMADVARREAEKATGDRQSSERDAIQAAQRARAAETALNQFQQALVTARQQQASAEADLLRQQRTGESLKDTLEDATNKKKDLEATDTSMMSDQQKKDHAELIKQARKDELAAQRKVDASDRDTTQKQSVVTAAKAQVASAENHVNQILAEIQNARGEEARKRETVDKQQYEEDTKYKYLFRREVAAATEDPDTYAPGKPDSQDPIEQVSLSVIGEGLIQLRGPLKGVNLARTIINQIDAPVGQVKVAIHTVQVNGEHGERMEPVIGRIQRYIDHSRFLTTQSAQMLRNAVTLVASRRADQAASLCEGLSQQERDHKYIEMFFGREFLEELRTLDSEFLHTGNKLLSLHSMDSTSLSNALFLLAIAKNDVRQEILQAFEQMVTCNLPQDEMDYFTASNEKYKFGPMFHKQKFVFLGQNAKFVSLRGFFNAEVAGSETMTPMQREFIRLAQIFKSRLVTEIELQQRVMERSLIEDRGDSPDSNRAHVLKKESDANSVLELARVTKRQAQEKIVSALSTFATTIDGTVETIETELDRDLKSTVGINSNSADSSPASIIQMLAEDEGRLKRTFKSVVDKQEWTIYGLVTYPDFKYKVTRNDIEGLAPSFTISTKEQEVTKAESAASEARFVPPQFVLHHIIDDVIKAQLSRLSRLKQFAYSSPYKNKMRDAETTLVSLSAQTKLPPWNAALASRIEDNGIPTPPDIPYSMIFELHRAAQFLDDSQAQVKSTAKVLREQAMQILQLLGQDRPNDGAAYQRWTALYQFLGSHLASKELNELLATEGKKVESAFQELITTRVKEDFALRNAEGSRRPLDHKKFLDMLIDDVEDKFIELMEGTRAHTANIDNYLSRLGQALEDDFNTQFYFPAFKGIREASRYWDVQMGQIETTTILTNNRTFAKVSPQATMEFDLPKRDILIKEAFDSAQAAYEDYGALLGDPTFLALTKMYRGQPASALFGGDSGNPAVRNVLPGLPASTDEKLVAQAQAVAPDFPSALESLIPDPAIYKFETGTGFEIRPVIQPDGQAVVFHFNYMYTTNVREPVRPDEKHLGRVKRHFIDTDVQTGNYEMREVSKYQVALKASRTARGVPLLEDIPAAGILFRPLPNQESSIQQNIILAQTAIFPTLFDLMGLRWAPAVADLDSLRLKEADFVTRGRQRGLKERVFDHSSQQVDEFLRIPEAERRPDLYRPQETTPYVHPNGYSGPGFGLKDGILREGHNPSDVRSESRFVPGTSRDVGGVPLSIDQSIEVEAPLMEGPSLAPPRGASPQPALKPRHVPEAEHNQGPPPLKDQPGARLDYQSIPQVPASRMEAPTPYSRSTGSTNQSATKGTSNSALQLQSYRSTSASSVQAAPTTAVPSSATPNSKPSGLQPGQLSPTSAPPQRLPEAPSGIRPAVGSTNSSSKNGTASNTKAGAVSKADASRNPSARDSKATKTSQIVQTSGTESDQFEPAPVPSKKKFGISGAWSKK